MEGVDVAEVSLGIAFWACCMILKSSLCHQFDLLQCSLGLAGHCTLPREVGGFIRIFELHCTWALLCYSISVFCIYIEYIATHTGIIAIFCENFHLTKIQPHLLFICADRSCTRHLNLCWTPGLFSQIKALGWGNWKKRIRKLKRALNTVACGPKKLPLCWGNIPRLFMSWEDIVLTCSGFWAMPR
jgi:hypothetical protein